MSTQLMTQAQQSTPAADAAAWALVPGEALRLPIGPGARRLQVTHGRLWLTRRGTAGQPAEDLWLLAGQGLTLPSGSVWVAEGWGETRFQLLVPPSACALAARRLSASWMKATKRATAAGAPSRAGRGAAPSAA